jgi:hypothetical protein
MNKVGCPQYNFEYKTPLQSYKDRLRQARRNLSNSILMLDQLYKYTVVREATSHSAYEVMELSDQILELEKIMLKAVQGMAAK